MKPITRTEIVEELKRELTMREAVYANQVRERKLKPETAERRKMIIRRTIEIVETYPDPNESCTVLNLFDNG